VIEPEQHEPLGSETAESWVVGLGDDLRLVEAYRHKPGSFPEEWPWGVVLGIAEFARTDELERGLFGDVSAAIAAVPGVTEVVQEDREVWLVAGTPEGRDLVIAAATAAEPWVAKVRAFLDTQGPPPWGNRYEAM
jgi:hypothetical protein